MSSVTTAASVAASTPIPVLPPDLQQLKRQTIAHLTDAITDAAAPPRERRLAASAILRYITLIEVQHLRAADNAANRTLRRELAQLDHPEADHPDDDRLNDNDDDDADDDHPAPDTGTLHTSKVVPDEDHPLPPPADPNGPHAEELHHLAIERDPAVQALQRRAYDTGYWYGYTKSPYNDKPPYIPAARARGRRGLADQLQGPHPLTALHSTSPLRMLDAFEHVSRDSNLPHQPAPEHATPSTAPDHAPAPPRTPDPHSPRPP